jgi:hypothetical protein
MKPLATGPGGARITGLPELLLAFQAAQVPLTQTLTDPRLSRSDCNPNMITVEDMQFCSSSTMSTGSGPRG